MSDEKQPLIKTNPIPDETTNALLKPPATSIGNATNDLLEGIFNLLLTPVRKYNIVKQKDMEDFQQKIYDKKNNVATENLDDSKKGLVLKTMEDSRYQLNEEEFREYFSNLIVSSMDSSKNDKISPNFSTILSNLSVTQAALFEKIYKNESQVVPCITFRLDLKDGTGGSNYLEDILIFDNEIDSESQADLTALETFGLIKFSKDSFLTDPSKVELYEKFETTTLFENLKTLSLESDFNFSLIRSYYCTTKLGDQFAAVTIA